MRKSFIPLVLMMSLGLSACGLDLFTPKTNESSESVESVKTSIESQDESTDSRESTSQTSSLEDYPIDGNIVISGYLDSTVYTEGDEYSHSGLRAHATFSVTGYRDITDEVDWYVVGLPNRDHFAQLGTEILEVVAKYGEYSSDPRYFSITVNPREQESESESGGGDTGFDYIIDGTFKITGQPNKTTYIEGETFEHDGLRAEADFYYAGHRDITDECSWDVRSAGAGNTFAELGYCTIEVIAYYGEYQSQPLYWPITVLPRQDESTSEEDYIVPGSLRIQGELKKTYYVEGEKWSSKGLTATLDYSISGPKDVTKEATWNIYGADGDNGLATLGVTTIKISVSMDAEYWQESYDVIVKAKDTTFIPPQAASEVYQRINSKEDLELNKTYIISYFDATQSTGNDKSMTMSTNLAKNNIKQVITEYHPGGKIIYNTDILYLELVEGIIPGSYAFRVCNHPNYPDSNRFLATTESETGNILTTSDAVTTLASFDISFTEGVMEIRCLGKDTRNLLRYNNLGAQCFACYNPNKDLLPVSLFKETDESAPAVNSVMLLGNISKTEYMYPFENTWSSEGLGVNVLYSDSYSTDITNEVEFIWSPATPTLETTSVTVKAVYKGVESSEMTFDVTVREGDIYSAFSLDYNNLFSNSQEIENSDFNKNRTIKIHDYEITLDPDSNGCIKGDQYPYTKDVLGFDCVSMGRVVNGKFLKISNLFAQGVITLELYSKDSLMNKCPSVEYANSTRRIEGTLNGEFFANYNDGETQGTIYKFTLSFNIGDASESVATILNANYPSTYHVGKILVSA